MCFCCFTIQTAEVGVIEWLGAFNRVVQPGINVICCPMERLAGKLSLRVQQFNVHVETKTLDNVFLVAVVSVQYQVLREKVYEAFYRITNPAQTISEHVNDVMRSKLLTLEFDAVFEAKEELALAVKHYLAKGMIKNGYQIVQVLITDVDLDERVKDDMIKSKSTAPMRHGPKEMRDKILPVKVADADAEKMKACESDVEKSSSISTESTNHDT